jgi:predicted outer membrane repeat protein
MRTAAVGCLVSLWIASHVVTQTHGDETQIHPPSSTGQPHVRRQIQEDSDNAGLFFLYLLIYIFEFFDDRQVELRTLRRGRRLCRLFLPSNCICREGQLVRTIRQNRQAKICYGTTIKISREIGITGKSFTITCVRPTSNNVNRGNCKIIGSGSHRLFRGSPSNATFREIDMENGSASDGGIALLTGGRARFDACTLSHSRATTGNGGAIRISGGTLEINGTLGNNSAAGEGGAISASGSSTNVVLYGFVSSIVNSMEFNNATNGGALSVVDGARVTGNYFPCGFSGNRATINGGAIYIRNTTIDMPMAMSENTAGSKGDAVYVKNARLSLQWTSLGIPTFYTSLKSIWIDDDDDPSDGGSFVSCILSEPLDLAEIAGGPNQTQKFQNSNCPLFVRPPIFAPVTRVNPPSGPVPPIQRPFVRVVSPPS